MPVSPGLCDAPGPDGRTPSCHLETTSEVIPSIQYTCQGNQPAVQSVMVMATDPEMGFDAPFKLEPGQGCQNICGYHLGNSGLSVKDISVTSSTVRIGAQTIDASSFVCSHLEK